MSHSISFRARFLAFSLAAVASVGTLSSASADRGNVGKPKHGGTGCPAGTVSATFSPDESALSILFDQYIVTAKAGSGPGKKGTESKACQVAVPITLPAGQSFVISKVDYRGFRDLPAGARVKFKAQYGMQDGNGNKKGPSRVDQFAGPSSEDFTISESVDKAFKSVCGGEANLMVWLDLEVTTKQGEAMVSLDSSDMETSKEGALKFHVNWEPCQGR